MRRSAKILYTVVPLVVSIVAAPPAHAAFPGANGAISFGRTTSGQSDIWTVSTGGGTTRLTTTPHRNESMPDWNADGTMVAYTRCLAGKLSNCDIWVMDADGSNQTRITSTDAQETWPTWSPDGSQIAYTSNALDTFQDVWVMDADGGNQTRLTTTSAFDAFPEWSPDGSSQTQLTTTKRHEFAPAFSPDGLRIAFNREGRDHRFGVWTMPADGSVPARQRTFGLFDFFADWRPV